jgi:hypothetical protein
MSGRASPAQGASGVKAALTANSSSRRRRTYRETPDVVAALRRLIRSVGKRVATEDPEDLRHLLALREELDRAFETAVAGLRQTGYTDAEIGAALGGISRQAVHQRWPR